MGTVNHRFGYDKKKIQRMGKLFPTIDFERNESLYADKHRTRDKAAIIGKFLIGGKEFKVTHQELRRIAETAEAGLEVTNKAYRLGSMPGS